MKEIPILLPPEPHPLLSITQLINTASGGAAPKALTYSQRGGATLFVIGLLITIFSDVTRSSTPDYTGTYS